MIRRILQHELLFRFLQQTYVISGTSRVMHSVVIHFLFTLIKSSSLTAMIWRIYKRSPLKISYQKPSLPSCENTEEILSFIVLYNTKAISHQLLFCCCCSLRDTHGTPQVHLTALKASLFLSHIWLPHHKALFTRKRRSNK